MKKALYVYVFKCGKYYKIGSTSGKPKRRLSVIQSSNPVEVTAEIIIKHEQADQLEIDIHKYFENKRVRGEWFLLSKSDLKTIRKNMKKHIVPFEPYSTQTA